MPFPMFFFVQNSLVIKIYSHVVYIKKEKFEDSNMDFLFHFEEGTFLGTIHKEGLNINLPHHCLYRSVLVKSM